MALSCEFAAGLYALAAERTPRFWVLRDREREERDTARDGVDWVVLTV